MNHQTFYKKSYGFLLYFTFQGLHSLLLPASIPLYIELLSILRQKYNLDATKTDIGRRKDEEGRRMPCWPATVFLVMTAASGIVRFCALTWMLSDVETEWMCRIAHAFIKQVRCLAFWRMMYLWDMVPSFMVPQSEKVHSSEWMPPYWIRQISAKDSQEPSKPGTRQKAADGVCWESQVSELRASSWIYKVYGTESRIKRKKS